MSEIPTIDHNDDALYPYGKGYRFVDVSYYDYATYVRFDIDDDTQQVIDDIAKHGYHITYSSEYDILDLLLEVLYEKSY